MRRWIGILIAGVGIAILIGFVFAPSSRRKELPSDPSASVRVGDPPARSISSARKSNAEGNKLVLGNITTVPFQELYGLLSDRTSEELTQLAQQLRDLPPGRETDAKIAVFFKAWAHFDAKAALTAAALFKTGAAKGTVIGAVIEGADATVAGTLVTSINEFPSSSLLPGQKTRFLDRALSKWSEVDPIAAAKALDALPQDTLGFARSWRIIGENWAASDPQAALAWVEAHGDSQNAKPAMSGAIAGWWRNDPAAVEAYVASHLDTVGAETAMMLASRIFNQDPQRAKDWVNELPSVDARRRADSLIAMQSASTDPKGASEWAASLPEDAREVAMFSAVGAWTRHDPQAAAQWINNLSGALRDEAVSAYSFNVATTDPVAALNWATDINEPQIRERSVQQIVVGWLNRSPSDARAWIQSSTLSDVEKARLLALPVGR